MLKKETRVIGIDDSPFDKKVKGETLVIGTIFRGGSSLDGIVSTKVHIDGDNATERIIDMIHKCKWKSQLQCIFLDGIAFGGFNIIDIHEVNKKTNLPVIVVIRHMPDRGNIMKTLKKIGMDEKIKLIEQAGEVKKVNSVFIQHAGIDVKGAKDFLKLCCTHSLIPEPVRVSHMIASGILLGESKGRV